MSGRISPLSIAFALAAAVLAAMPSGAAAQCRLCSTPVTDSGSATSGESQVPLRIEVRTDLEFDQMVLLSQTSGTALLGANGEKRVTGAISGLSGRAMVGSVRIQGEPGRFVRVDLPSRIEVDGSIAGSLVIDNVGTDLGDAPQLDSNGELIVRFGGELRIDGEFEGEFRALVPVTVDYL